MTTRDARSVDFRLALAALLVRAVPVALLFALTPTTWDRYLSSSDAGSFLPVAKVVFGLEPLSSVKLFDTRVFPGWPLLFGPVLLAGLPDWFALVCSLGCSAAVPVLFRRLTGNQSLAWLLVVFPPAWLLAGFHPISEPAYLLGIIGAALALRGGHVVTAGLVSGMLLVIRPFGIAWIAAGGLALLLSSPRDPRALVRFSAAALVPALGLLLLNARIFGDPLHQVHVYGLPLEQLNLDPAVAARLGGASGHWDLPFKHVLLTPWRVPVPLWKVGYIYAHVTALLVLAALAVQSLRRPDDTWGRALTFGFLLNAVLIVCTGPYWGFHSFDRYFVWGLPGAVWLARRHAPGPRWVLALGAASAALSVRSLFGHLG